MPPGRSATHTRSLGEAIQEHAAVERAATNRGGVTVTAATAGPERLGRGQVPLATKRKKPQGNGAGADAAVIMVGRIAVAVALVRS
jgi:hypothetical protein